MKLTLANDAQSAAHGRGLPRFDDRSGAEIEIADASKYANSCDQRCAKKTDDNDLQVRAAVCAINGMIHWRLPLYLLPAANPFISLENVTQNTVPRFCRNPLYLLGFSGP